MPTIEIQGGKKLQGEVCAHGSKNAALPILASMVLFDDEEIIIENVPNIADVTSMNEVLQQIGMSISTKDGVVTVKTPKRAELAFSPSESLVSKMRATILLLGGLLSAAGEAEIALPGGCSIGYRPIDMHISALKNMGATIDLEHGIIIAKTPNGLNAATIHLDSPSVGATENIILAAVLTSGETIIENASREPEVLDLIRFLNQSGAKITGAGTSVIKIIGVEKLKGTRYEIITDRMEVATYMIAAAVTGGDITIHCTIPKHLETFIAKLREIGVAVQVDDDSIHVLGQKSYTPENVIDVRTAPYPGFSTDMQVLILPLLLQVKNSSMLMDNVFDQRFRHVTEFKRVGAEITQLENMLIVNQQKPLISGTASATDVRAAAALILLGLSSEITVTVDDMHHLIRGYEGLISALVKLGAQVKVIEYNGYEECKW